MKIIEIRYLFFSFILRFVINSLNDKKIRQIQKILKT